MKWVLVLILLDGVQPRAVQGGVYNSIMECFTERERFMTVQLDARPAQAVCIRAGTSSAS